MNTQILSRTTGVALLVLGLLLTLPAGAQMGMMKDGAGGQGMHQMSGMMHDMGDEMVSLSGQLAHGKLSAAQQKQMADRMRTMATMMDSMSGMMGKGMMQDAAHQKQMGEMRQKMDQMKKQPVVMTGVGEAGKSLKLKDGSILFIDKNGQMKMVDRKGDAMSMKDDVPMETEEGSVILMKNKELYKRVPRGTLNPKFYN